MYFAQIHFVLIVVIEHTFEGDHNKFVCPGFDIFPFYHLIVFMPLI